MLIYSESFNRILKWLLALVLSILLTDGYAGPKYWPAQKGQVLDAETGEPMAGVFVIARYWGYYPVPGHSSSSCYHAAGTTTNEQGEYRIPSHFDIMDIKVDKRSKINVFKPGYRHIFYKDGIAKLKKDNGSQKERLEYLRKVAGNTCSGAGKSQQALFPYYESIYYEAKALSSTKDELKQLEWFRRMAARIGTAKDSHTTNSEAELLREKFLGEHLQ